MASKKMRHPEAKGTIEVRDDAVEMHETQGWVVVDSPPTKSDK
jgi:hypothetical protein